MLQSMYQIINIFLVYVVACEPYTEWFGSTVAKGISFLSLTLLLTRYNRKARHTQLVKWM